jgi:ferrochelatase
MKKGILLINLGTPDSPSTKNVRKYLTEFLNDPRVIDVNPILRFILVNGIIVPFRAPRSAKLYREIWTEEGSPLLIHTKKLTEKVKTVLGNDYHVEFAMRYQNPSISSALEKLRKQKVSSITVLPLYPQYASSSSGSTIEKVMSELKKWEVLPDLKIISSFYDNPDYINAFVQKAASYKLDEYDHIVFSYHGLPERHIKKGATHYGSDYCQLGTCCNTLNASNRLCYRANCFYTTRKLVEKLSIPENKFTTTFQSRLNDRWIKPYSDDVIEQLAKRGAKKILVFSPAFVADCLETIYEIGVEYQEIFHEHGGEKVDFVESLNDSDLWVKAVADMVK